MELIPASGPLPSNCTFLIKTPFQTQTNALSFQPTRSFEHYSSSFQFDDIDYSVTRARAISPRESDHIDVSIRVPLESREHQNEAVSF